MDLNGNSACCNGNSFTGDNRKAASLPLWFRYGIPGFEAGWPAR